MTNPKVNKTLLFVLFFTLVIFAFSSTISTLKHNSIDLLKLGFIYKYLFIFTLPWIVVNVIKTEEQIRIVNWLLLLSFVFLSSWTYIYMKLLVSGAISGNFRPSFPLSNNYTYSDAHLYSSYLGFFIVAYLFYLRRFFSHNIFVSFIIITNGIAGLVLTGSRTGIVIVGLSILLYSIYNLIKTLSVATGRNKLKIRKKIVMYFMLFLLVFIFLIILVIPMISELLMNYEIYEILIKRAFNFNLTDDQSSLGRIEKLIIGLKDAEYSGLILGVGFNSSLIWYDGIFAILIAHGGFLFIFSIFAFYYLVIKKVALNSKNRKDFLVFLLLVVLYLVANLISEYIFVSRNAFPVLVVLSILYASILNKKTLYNSSKDNR